MPKANRECHTCGNRYYFCPTCLKDGRDPQIYIMFCSKECKEIFELLTDEGLQKITREDCKNQLLARNVTEEFTTRDVVKHHINRILSAETKEE